MTKTPLFPLGAVVATPGALALIPDQGPMFFAGLLSRHVRGDFGDLDEHDKAENNFALTRNLRIFSAYETTGGKLWIITEADRSSTCILTPDEY